MSWFHRNSEEDSGEVRAAKRAAESASRLVASNSREIEEARSLFASIQEMRMKNHLVERLTEVFKAGPA